jgi:putative acetyltransferase
MTQVSIRAYQPRDAPHLAATFFDAVRNGALRHYSRQQVEAWAPEAPDASRVDQWARTGRRTFVAVNELDEPVAYCDFEPDGHIDHLYCRPSYHGRGVASDLYDVVERTARQAGVTRLYLEASEAARRFFHRKGFGVKERRNFAVRGVQIHNFRRRLCLLQMQNERYPPCSRRIANAAKAHTLRLQGCRMH